VRSVVARLTEAPTNLHQFTPWIWHSPCNFHATSKCIRLRDLPGALAERSFSPQVQRLLLRPQSRGRGRGPARHLSAHRRGDGGGAEPRGGWHADWHQQPGMLRPKRGPKYKNIPEQEIMFNIFNTKPSSRGACLGRKRPKNGPNATGFGLAQSDLNKSKALVEPCERGANVRSTRRAVSHKTFLPTARIGCVGFSVICHHTNCMGET
jgi:hypothetical protein